MTTAASPDDRIESSMMRSEEQLFLSTEWVAVERVVARRRIVSETVQIAVTIRREELVIERSTVEGAPAGDPSPVQVPPLVVVLREEVPVVTLEVQPYARASVSIVQIAGEQNVTTSLDSERIHVETTPH
jgi:uncharacterized protein (TIGR02271 family)